MPGKMIGIMDENIYFDISSVFSGSPYPYTDVGTDSPAILCGGKEIYGQMLRYLQEGNLFSQKELTLIYERPPPHCMVCKRGLGKMISCEL